MATDRVAQHSSTRQWAEATAKQVWVYIAASRSGVLYVGVTNDLERRMGQHQAGGERTFTGRYRCSRLVFAQQFESAADAIAAEKKLKGWRRARKVALIDELNPEWADLTGRFEASSYHRERTKDSSVPRRPERSEGPLPPVASERGEGRQPTRSS